MNTVDVVTFGEVLANFVADDYRPIEEVETFHRRMAGAEANVAVGLARLGHRVRYLGLVGDDPMGRYLRAALAAEQVDVDSLLTHPVALTAHQLKNRVHDGDPTIYYYRRGSAGSRLVWSSTWEHALAGARHLHATGIPPALSATAQGFALRAVKAARAQGMTVSFDPNLRPALWSGNEEMVEAVNAIAVQADWVLPGFSEGMLLTGRDSAEGIADFYLSRGAQRVVVKRGGQGATLFTADGVWSAPVYPVQPVDTVGAGDGFAAGLISAHLDGLDAEAALHRAAAVGALATTSEGDLDGLPTRAQLDRLIAAQPV